MTRILVIKLGAFGDVVQSFPAFAAIRAHHRDAHITLLTTAPFVALAEASPWFDEVWSGGRPAWHDLPGMVRLARRLRAGRFDRVYDLQDSRRSSRYRLAVGWAAEWSGSARGASHAYDRPDRKSVVAPQRHREQLAIAGIPDVPPADMGWLDADLSGLGLPPRFCLLIPGASARMPEKRWPAERYAELAQRLPIPAVVVGGPAEAPIAAAICAAAPATRDLCGDRSPPPVLGALARRAAFAVGNDTGPTHLVAALGCPTLTLFGPRSDPAKHAPQGPAVAVIRVPSLAGLGVEGVLAALSALVPEEVMPAPDDAGQWAESGSRRPGP
ncbi:MAG TPA: glycosyltransferase family 9 protein [Acetobacteraceae bacterium]|nr:glycosyltransferase family 9 protein [Acetobacteraceae bacterium]